MSQLMRQWIQTVMVTVAAVVMVSAAALAEENKDKAPAVICGGCISPAFTNQGKGSITPYGRIELDVIYSNRNTNPLDPSQFNGYATAASKTNNSSSTFNPRYSVFGLRGERTDGKHSLTGVVEVDFYGQTDNAGNLPPRLRLANVRYGVDKFSITVGMDWNPIMGLLPNLLDFSIMGYNGNLWNRLPQITMRYKVNDNWDALFTVMRFERGLSQIGSQTQRKVASTIGSNSVAFDDPEQIPYFGGRVAYNGTGNLQGVMAAFNVAYRYYRSAPAAPGTTAIPGGRDINSYLVGAELVVPITPKLKFSGELAYGQGLGVEWFRFGQERDVISGKPVRTLVGWAELDYAYSQNYTFIGGYGFDNPLNSDLQPAAGRTVDSQYLLNHRFYLTAVRHLWGDFYTGLEWNHVMTQWSTPGDHYQGDNYMMSFWYNF